VTENRITASWLSSRHIESPDKRRSTQPLLNPLSRHTRRQLIKQPGQSPPAPDRPPVHRHQTSVGREHAASDSHDRRRQPEHRTSRRQIHTPNPTTAPQAAPRTVPVIARNPLQAEPAGEGFWTMGVWSVRSRSGLARSRQRRRTGMCGGCSRVGGQIQPRERASWTASWRLAAPSLAAAEDR
jgi:hypothetical protein